MISKFFCLFYLFFLTLFTVFQLKAAQIDFLPVGNMKRYGTNIYKSGVNDIRNHRSQDKINALYLKLYTSKKEKKKEKSRYTMIEFVIRMSPYVKDYNAFKGDFMHPFSNLAFGFHENTLTPVNYNGLDLLISYPLYDYPYSLRKGVGVETISKLDTQKRFSFNSEYVKSAIRSLKGTDVLLSFLGEMKPFTVTDKNDDSIVQLITPVRPY